MSKHVLSVLFIAMMMIPAAIPGWADQALDQLTPDATIADFRVETVYENDAGVAMGARFRHVPSNFVLDLLRIQSVPQAFMWVNSPPPSDQGEPHTCEHLLLGKGTKGRYVASLEDMSLGNSSAFTMQLQTCYHYHTEAGVDVFFELLEAKLDAMLHPTFSDEEIRREVCNVGYTVDPVDSTLRLEEKGTVYNEMESTFERPWSNLGRALDHMMYGDNHPLALSSGGLPAAIRTMTPDDMRKFHSDTHHLNNMGMIVAIPDEITLEDFLSRTSEVLATVEPDAQPGTDPATLENRLPPPTMAPEGEIRQVSFPHQNNNEPGLLVYGWGPTLELENNEEYVLDLFMDLLAGGSTSNLYRKFIDSQTREMDLGANSVFGWVSSDPGHAIYVGFNNVDRRITDVEMIDSVRAMMLREIKRIADLPDGSEELKSFNERARSLVIEGQRDQRRFLNTPPRFGFRGTGASWFFHLKHLQEVDGFRKRLTLDSEFDFANSLLDSGTNFWNTYIGKWGLLDRKPYGVAARPDPQLITEIEDERQQRLDAYAAEFKEQFDVDTPNEAIVAFKDEYDSRTAEIDETAKSIEMPSFLDNPPLTLDDQLQYDVTELPGGGSFVVSTFENMTSATVGLAFDAHVIPEEHLLYLAALPTLMTDVGVIHDGEAIAYDEMKDRLRREILSLNVNYSPNHRTQRVELVVTSSGIDGEEAHRAMDWMNTVLFDANWQPDNLPRIRDAVDLALAGARNRMRGSEESWVDEPANAYWRQNNPLMMVSGCFLTQAHALHRLRWKLKEVSSPVAYEAFRGFMQDLSAAVDGASDEQLRTLLSALSGGDDTPDPMHADLVSRFKVINDDARDVIREAADDLTKSLADSPRATRTTDWKYLCRQMTDDAAMSPQLVLDGLRDVLSWLRHQDNVRGYMVGNTSNQESLMPRVTELVNRFDSGSSLKQMYARQARIIARMQDHAANRDRPVFVGLVNKNTRSGVHINSSESASYLERDPDKLMKFLSARLYGGGGAHSMFMKTWGAGLAYSNGLRHNESTGRLIYYAERCPDLAQTMQFVVNEVKNAPYDPSLADYAVAQAFVGNRGGARYEQRGAAMAADLADGVTPDVVREFRRGVLSLRDTENLYDQLHERMPYTYGEVLPGVGPRGSEVPNAIYFVIGPEKQFESYEEYLKSVEGDVTLHRLYPRDFWLVDRQI
ncbi:MAG: hypothetical protein GF341_00830 [candidate division Zixibacteria bacterium]|nr:hypothetical protein [candidate division Zixibacteria bacterium]